MAALRRCGLGVRAIARELGRSRRRCRGSCGGTVAPMTSAVRTPPWRVIGRESGRADRDPVAQPRPGVAGPLMQARLELEWSPELISQPLRREYPRGGRVLPLRRWSAAVGRLQVEAGTSQKSPLVCEPPPAKPLRCLSRASSTRSVTAAEASVRRRVAVRSCARAGTLLDVDACHPSRSDRTPVTAAPPLAAAFGRTCPGTWNTLLDPCHVFG
jgi:hypothetical protein